MNTLVNLPKTKRGQATLDRICSSAEQLFFKKGYHATSINDITYKAKVAPGTFYIYFTDKVSPTIQHIVELSAIDGFDIIDESVKLYNRLIADIK